MANFELYKIFTIVAREQNLTRASKILNISQPAVSKHIKNLENELNEILFVRTNGMELTPKGKELYDEILPAVNIILEAEQKLYGNRNISFGTFSTMLSKVLSNCIADFYNENTNSKIVVVTEPFRDLFSRFLKYELDILYVEKYDESLYDTSDVKYIKCGEANFSLVANNISKFCDKVISLSDLHGEVIYMPRGETESTIHFEKLLKENNIECKIKKIDTVTMLSILEQHDAIGFVNIEYVQKELDEKKITKLDMSFEIEPTEYGIYIHKNNNSKDLMNFVKILKNRR